MEQKSSKFEIYPLVKMQDGWSIPDEVLIGIWAQIVSEGKDKIVFYDASVKTIFDWIEFAKRPDIFLILVANKQTKQIVHVFWLRDVFDIGAWVHHCSVGKYQRNAWEAARDYWRKYFPNLKLLMGMVPETNTKTIKMLKNIAKFTVVGKIPQMCNMGYEGKRVSSVLSYYEL